MGPSVQRERESPFFLIQAALPYLLKTKGSVVNVSSINGARVAPNNMVYDSMKAALNHMTAGFTIDYRDQGVRFNALLPAGVDTLLLENAFKQQITDPQRFEEAMAAVRKSPKLARPEQIADMIVLVASDKASWLNGASIPLEGGYSLGHP
ncbi:SDR family oxidoreductase [Paenibacillus albus]|uniref:SDR family oxidoreductase n=1 Tax=Paenibacillus albus TaxID=2495582 RepID=A0A3Q8X8X4_9BACL|nr:SDR family oxidoreductase [Paenibacillus albus]AZN43152.1 SDR family oxidoreductase [Paenibacillus albus]